MKVVVRNLSVLAYASGFTLWTYNGGAQSIDEIAEVGFFDDVADMLAAGDQIHISAAKSGALVYVHMIEPSVVIGILGISTLREDV